MNLPESPYQPTDPPTASRDTRLAPGRPTSITVIAWLLIVGSCINLFELRSDLNDPELRDLIARSPVPIPVFYFMVYGGQLITVVSGIGMLKGQNWARLLCFIWWIVGFLVGFATFPTRWELTIAWLGISLLIAFFLFRPKANQYFLATEPTNGSQVD